MKRKPFSTVFGILAFFLFSAFFLMSYIPREESKTKLAVHFSKSDIEKLSNNAFADPVCQLIYKKDIQNIIDQANNTSVVNKDILEKIAKKSRLSGEEFNSFISTVSGFRDQKDFDQYIDLYRRLIKKYKINKLSAEGQRYFFEALKNREIEYTGQLVELSKNALKRDSLNKLYSSASGVRPECWKCVYDYQACVSPVVGTTTTSVYTVSADVYYVNIISSSGTTTYSVTSYNDPDPPVVSYTAPVLQSNSCTAVYQSCVSQCNQP